MHPGYAPLAEHSDNWSQDVRWDTSTPYGYQRPLDQLSPQRALPRELAPKDWDHPIGRWRQGPKILRNVKSTYCFTRPSDGKRRGTLGRLKDALTGEGADVYITITGDKGSRMRDRPQRWQWTGRGLTWDEMQERRARDLEFRESNFMPLLGQTTRAREKRARRPYYNFRTRRFEAPNAEWEEHPGHMWLDARWPEGVKRRCQTPLSVEDGDLIQWSRVPSGMGRVSGGRPML